MKMGPQDPEHQKGRDGNISRREILKQSVAIGMLPLLSPLRALANDAPKGKVFAYVGTYSGGGDSSSNGKGIYLFEMDPATGELKLVNLAASARNASWLSIDPSGRHLYAVNEVADFGGTSGAVSAFAIDRTTGKLTPLNVVGSEGAGPAYLSIDRSGKVVLVANFAGGSVAVLPILSTGALGEATDVHRDTGSVGPLHATTAPPGSFAISGHEAPRAHMIHVDPHNRFAVQADLGQDRIYVWKFDPATGKLSPAASPFFALPPGDGPRHFVFHSNGRWLYSTQEEASTVVFFHFDPANGALQPQQTISTLPSGVKGTNYTAEILLSPDERFLYVSNRLHDTIAIFSLDGDGRLTYVGETATMGDYPRDIQMAPDGAFLYVCNHRSDVITCFRVDRQTGLLTFTGQYTPVGSPACMVFLT
jgi:6-phosphogluconolactonase